MLKKRKKDKKGSVTLYVAFFITAIVIIAIASVFAPMGVLFNTEMYIAGEGILLDANDSIQNIQDPVIRAQVEATVQSALSQSVDNIELNSDIFQYSWIFVLILSAIMVFLYTRTLTEVNQGGFQ